MENIEIKEFLSKFVVTGDVGSELKRQILNNPVSKKKKPMGKSTSSQIMGFGLGNDFAVVHREKSYKSEAVDFVRKFFRNDKLEISQTDVTTRKNAKQLLSFLKWELSRGKKHAIIVMAWSDIPTDHYQYLIDNAYAVLVVNDLNGIEPIKDIDYLKQGPLIIHAMENSFKMKQHLAKLAKSKGSRKSHNIKTNKLADEKKRATYPVLVEVLVKQSRALGKQINQTEVLNYINDNSLLDWKLSQRFVSHTIKDTGNKENWDQLCLLLKLEFKARSFAKTANGKSAIDVIRYIIKEAKKSRKQLVSYSQLYEFIFNEKWEGQVSIRKISSLLAEAHSLCIDADVPIVNTLIGPKYGHFKEHIKQKMLDFYIDNDGDEKFDNAEHFYTYFRQLCLGYDLHLLDLLPEVEL